MARLKYMGAKVRIQNSMFKQRLKFLQQQGGIGQESKGPRQSAQLLPLYQRLGALLDGRRAGVYKRTCMEQEGTLLKCVTCNTVCDAVRNSTVFGVLQHECSDAHWHVFQQDSPAALRFPAFGGGPLLGAAGRTRAHEELPSFEAWLAHGAPWHGNALKAQVSIKYAYTHPLGR